MLLSVPRVVRAAAVLLVAACGTVTDPTAHSLQKIVVTTADANATRAMMQRYERASNMDKWVPVGEPVPVVIGRTGLATPGNKREGDGKSPAGVFELGTAFGFEPSGARITRMPYRQLRSTTECVDDSSSRYYNRIVDRHEVSVDWNSSEKMRDIAQYRWGIVVNHNVPPQKQRGSCIFIHVWSGPSSTTAGCTAMDENTLLDLLRWLDPAKKPRLIQLVA